MNLHIVFKKIYKFRGLFLISIFIFLVGCASTVTREKADWSYASKAIEVDFKTGKNLNYYDGYSHALAVAIIQVSSPNALKGLLKTHQGAITAIDNVKPVSGQTSFTRISLQPNENKKILLDRFKGTQYVYLIFGYAANNDQKDNYLIPIPLSSEPMPLNIRVALEKTYISNITFTK